jgi:hypothetical protein
MKTASCSTPGCRNTRKVGHGKSSRCEKCRSRARAKKYPLRVIWLNLKKSAKRRAIQFDLDRDAFESWAAKAGLLEARGRYGFCASVDRIDHTQGYALWNIQVITVSENSRKSHYEGARGKNTETGDDIPF